MTRFRCPRLATQDGRGQILPLFAISLVAILAIMGLGLDAAQSFLERRDAQGAADLAALSAARFLPKDAPGATAQAKAVGVLNGYAPDDVHVTAPYQGSSSKIKVEIDSKTDMFFLPILGINELDVDASGTDKNHTLLLKNGATLRVDGDIVVNSTNGGDGPACTLDPVKKVWEVCGDGFDIFGNPITPPAYISAKSISVAGGWETHDENVVMADDAVWPDYSTYPQTYSSCPGGSPDPPAQTQTSNVCIHVPQIAEPLNDTSPTGYVVVQPVGSGFVVPTVADCSSGNAFPSTSTSNSVPLAIISDKTICPGLYYGGVSISGGTTTMLPGVYYMVGNNGFSVSGSGSVDGSSGVLIYSSATTGGSPATVDILPDPDLTGALGSNRVDPKVTIKSSKNPFTYTDKEVKYAFTVDRNGKSGPNLNGVVRFYDGVNQISTTSGCTPVTITNKDKKQSIDCKISYTSADIGFHGIAAVFHKGSGLAACSLGTIITTSDGVTGPEWALMQPPPGPCGALGGISCTIYAPTTTRW